MAGQYEDAFSPPRLQCWTVPRPPPKGSPWGTFLGTWDMPARVPPARLDLSAREPRAAESLRRGQPRELRRACNGLRTRVTGKLQKPWDTEPSGKDQGGPSGGLPPP
ncbi:protein Flattop isoform X2 [Passer domesticus]|uniref:protein Flattop isoform X2 n=1 Tax=Passer domesticus TaxID=48849 RepID=UPI0030FEA0CE